ncbi:hypothetical protein GQ600_20177 [Phytophthora cactorum]|nr:hypothetical protein GQ600_20177 [Phytophthora cactorum]
MSARSSQGAEVAIGGGLTDRASLDATVAVVDATTIHNACISSKTRNKYTGNINGIETWIHKELSDQNTARLFYSSNDLNLEEFTPAFFEEVSGVQNVPSQVSHSEWIS